MRFQVVTGSLAIMLAAPLIALPVGQANESTAIVATTALPTSSAAPELGPTESGPTRRASRPTPLSSGTSRARSASWARADAPRQDRAASEGNSDGATQQEQVGASAKRAGRTEPPEYVSVACGAHGCVVQNGLDLVIVAGRPSVEVDRSAADTEALAP